MKKGIQNNCATSLLREKNYPRTATVINKGLLHTVGRRKFFLKKPTLILDKLSKPAIVIITTK